MAKQTSFSLLVVAGSGIFYKSPWFDSAGYKKATIQISATLPTPHTLAVGQTSILESYLSPAGANIPIATLAPASTTITATGGQTIDICSDYINIQYLASIGTTFTLSITLED